jgi:hypothetical protein
MGILYTESGTKLILPGLQYDPVTMYRALRGRNTPTTGESYETPDNLDETKRTLSGWGTLRRARAEAEHARSR